MKRDKMKKVFVSGCFDLLHSGHGGYTLYLFETSADKDRVVQNEKDFLSIEPYCRLFGGVEKK